MWFIGFNASMKVNRKFDDNQSNVYLYNVKCMND